MDYYRAKKRSTLSLPSFIFILCSVLLIVPSASFQSSVVVPRSVSHIGTSIRSQRSFLTIMSESSSTTSFTTSSITAPLSWADLQQLIGQTAVGKALTDDERNRRQLGQGAPHVENTLRQFDSSDEPKITLYRDHAGWYVSQYFL